MENINKNVKNIPHFMVENLRQYKLVYLQNPNCPLFLVKDVGHSVIATNKKQTN